MSLISEWSVVPAQNGTRGSPPNYWPEGQAPSTVNDCARLMMSTLRIQMQDAQWFDWGFTCTRLAGNKFSMRVTTASATTSVLSKFLPGSRMKLYDTSTMYATITETSQSSTVVNITVNIDSGSLTNSFTSAFLSIISPINSALPTIASGGSSVDNLLVNSDFRVGQQGTSFTSATTPANSDDTYLFDQWILLSDGNDIVDVSQDTTNVPQGAYASMKLDIETANKKFGFLQPLEALNSAGVINGQVSLSFSAKKDAGNVTFETLRCAVISWTGTADTITSDVVSAWNAAGTDPTLVANWTYENTPTNLVLTSSFQTFTINSISIDTASTKQIALFFWCDDTDATVGDLAYVTKFNLTIGASVAMWEPVDAQIELLDCLRYFINNITTGGSGVQPLATGYAISTTVARCFYFYPAIMRISPTGVTTNATKSDYFISNNAGGAAGTVSNVTFVGASATGLQIEVTTSAGLTQGDGVWLSDSGATPAFLQLSARL